MFRRRLRPAFADFWPQPHGTSDRCRLITGVAVLGGVAAGVALIVARAVALAEEEALELDAESLERRLGARLDRRATGADRGAS
jgi:hypothetical protein